MPAPASDSPDQRLTAAQWILLAMLAAVQVTHIVDFMILMPLATRLQADLHISIRQFGVLISAYGFSAAICFARLRMPSYFSTTLLIILFRSFSVMTVSRISCWA